MTRIAIIDLGTNSVRFDIHSIGKTQIPKRLHREKLMVRLGQGVFTDSKLDPLATKRTLVALKSFQKTSRKLHVTQTIAFATSALREASDREKFIAQVKKETGIQVRLLSGEEEARLIAKGILKNEKSLKGRFALIDIGGGSCEISVCSGKKMLESASFPLGVARIQQVFLKTIPPMPPLGKEISSIEQARRSIQATLLSKMISEKWPKSKLLVASSGTAHTLAKICGNGKSFRKKDLKTLIKNLSKMSAEQILGIPKMEPKRVDLILAGALVMSEAMDALGSDRVLATEFSLRDGILDEESEIFKLNEKSHLSFHFDDLAEKAKSMGASLPHLQHVMQLSEDLFQGLKKVHSLTKDDLNLLKAAALLHDIGESISISSHAEHSAYIIENSDFQGITDSEKQIITALSRFHVGGEPAPQKLPFLKTTLEKNNFLKLLSLLRIADALDRDHAMNVKIMRVQVKTKMVILSLKVKQGAHLELLRLEQKKMLFEKVFGRKIEIALA